MSELIEVFPFVFGVLLGLTWRRFGGPHGHYLPWALASAALGSFATLASGEWRTSPIYFLFDIGLVTVVSAAAALAVVHWARWRERNARG